VPLRHRGGAANPNPNESKFPPGGGTDDFLPPASPQRAGVRSGEWWRPRQRRRRLGGVRGGGDGGGSWECACLFVQGGREPGGDGDRVWWGPFGEFYVPQPCVSLMVMTHHAKYKYA
jgi:hypothetical protein